MQEKDLYSNPEPINKMTDYGKGLDAKIDPRTDFGKGISYKTCDGKELPSMEEVMLYNQLYYEKMMNKAEQDYSEKRGIHR